MQSGDKLDNSRSHSFIFVPVRTPLTWQNAVICPGDSISTFNFLPAQCPICSVTLMANHFHLHSSTHGSYENMLIFLKHVYLWKTVVQCLMPTLVEKYQHGVTASSFPSNYRVSISNISYSFKHFIFVYHVRFEVLMIFYNKNRYSCTSVAPPVSSKCLKCGIFTSEVF